jgi:hypothetical protein
MLVVRTNSVVSLIHQFEGDSKFDWLYLAGTLPSAAPVTKAPLAPAAIVVTASACPFTHLMHVHTHTSYTKSAEESRVSASATHTL